MAALIFFIATAQALNIRTGSAILPGRPSPVASAALATSRRDVIGAAAALGFAALSSDVQIAAAEDEVTLPSGLKYTVLKKGSNTGKPVVGDLVAIRFKCSIKSTGAVIDNILDNPEAYYYRVGSGQVLPCVEEAVKLMTTGDKWDLTVPPELGFGTKGRPSSPGKPRISGDAILDYVLELVAVPGKDEELLEELGASE